MLGKGKIFTERPEGKGSKNKTSSAYEKFKFKIPATHGYLFYKLRALLKRRCTYCFLQTSEVLETLKTTFKIPRKMKYRTLAEMEFYGLIKRINHQKYYISDKKEHDTVLRDIEKYLDEGAFDSL
jgi:hypothetical protein